MNLYNQERGHLQEASLPDMPTDEQLVRKRSEELEWQAYSQELPQGFAYDADKWLVFERKNQKGEIDRERICSQIAIPARSRDDQNKNHGRLIRIWDPDGFVHDWSMPMKILAGDGKEVRAELLSRGLEIARTPGANRRLIEFLQASKPDKKFTCIERTGWYNDLFVTPIQTYSLGQNEVVVFQSSHRLSREFTRRGTLKNFHDVMRLCEGNDLLIFSVAFGFSAPFLDLLKIESGGFHFVGPSSSGKSRTLMLANSIWGPSSNLLQWRTTANGLEGLACEFCDGLLCLDELGQVDARGLGAMIYMLSNGRQKARGSQYGGVQPVKSWVNT